MSPFLSCCYRRFRLSTLLLIIVYISLSSVTAQDKFNIVHYDVDDGLSHPHVTSVLEHSGGFVWVGSKDGLDRFDGYEFVKIELPKHPSITYGSEGPFIYSMRELEDGKIFMDFLQHSNLDAKIVYLFDPVSYEAEIIVDYKSDTLTFSACDYQMGSKDSTGIKFLGRDCIGNAIVIEYASSTIFLQLKDGRRVELSDDLISEKFQIGFMGLDFSKKIYAKSTNGILKITPSFDHFDKFLNEDIKDWDFGPRVRAICPVNGSEILVSIEDDNLKKINLETKEIKDLVFRDAVNDTIVSTAYLTAIMKDSDSVYYATSLEFAFLKFNTSTLKAEHILQDNKFISYLHHHSIRLKNGRILIGGGNNHVLKLIAYDPATGRIDHFQIGHPFIENKVHRIYLLEGKDGTIWLGTDYGLVHLDYQEKEILSSYKKITEKDQEAGASVEEHTILHGEGVISLYEDHDGLIWIGLDKGGLDVLDPTTNTIKNYNVGSGLAGNTIAGIQENKGQFWVSTYTGLSVIDTSNENITTFRKEDGLAHREFNRLSAATTQEGEMIFGGMNGIVSFDPNFVVYKNERLTIHLSEIEHYKSDGRTIINKKWPLQGRLSIPIPASSRTCAFKFFLSDFTNPESSIYEYKLVNTSRFAFQGSDDWKNNGTRNEIRFNHLESGDYTLYVRGKTDKGLISDTYALDLAVANYFYKSPWFIVLLMTCVSLLIYLFYRLKVNQMKKIESVRSKLSSDLHDNVGSLLSGVAYQMELLAYSVDEKQIGLVQKIASSSRKAMIKMRDIAWALDNRNSNYQNLADRFHEHAEEMLGPLQILFSIHLDPVLLNKEIDSKKKHELLSIFQEFITNTIKHSGASEVKIYMDSQGKDVHFLLKDNGKGIANAVAKDSGLGLKNMELRTQNINGTINFAKQPGFQVEIVFPQKG